MGLYAKILFLFVLLATSGYAQIANDSINSLLNNKTDAEKAEYLNTLAEQYLQSDPELSGECAVYAFEISKKNNNLIGEITSSVNAGKAYKVQKEYSKSLAYFQVAIDILVSNKLETGLGYCYSETGNLNTELEKYNNALSSYKKALAVYEDKSDSTNQYYILNNIANIYIKPGMQDYKMAGAYFYSAYKIIEGGNDDYEKAALLNKVGACYGNYGNYDDALKYLKSAYQLALACKSDNGLLESIKDNITNVEFNISSKNSAETNYESEKKELEQQYISALKTENVENKEKTLKTLEEIELLSVENQAKELKLKLLNEMYEKETLTNKVYEQNIILLDAESKLNKEEINKKTEKLNNQRKTIFLVVSCSVLILLLLTLIFRIKQKGKLAQQKLLFQKEQLRAIIDTQEDERTRFARDIHDGIGQYFFALKLKISQLEEDNLSNATKTEIYQKAMEIINELQQEIRNISFAIMPPMLTYKGLLAALEELIERIQKTSKIKIKLETFKFSERLDVQTEVALYRIIQEVLNNIVKHSNATKVSIQFTMHENELNLMIEDDGDGFDTKLLESSKGSGGRNIKSRIEMISGSISFDSQSERKSSSVIINIPLNMKSNGREN